MSAIINAIGVISGILSVIQFGVDTFGDQDEGSSVVRIQVGLDSVHGLSNAGGHLPDVRLYNEVGNFLSGVYDPGDIEEGTGSDVSIKQESEQQATYGLFTANSDAICIAYITIVWPDGQKFGWTGDWAHKCRREIGTNSWYYSNIVLGEEKNKLKCMWIDGNGDQPITGFQVHFPEFVSNGNLSSYDVEYYCAGGPPCAVRYDEDPKGIIFWLPDGVRHGGFSKRDSHTSVRKSDSPGSWNSTAPHHGLSNNTIPVSDPRLVISSDKAQDAEELCTSVGSYGPDFLNIAQGLFCHMSTKQLFPICDERTRTDCFDSNTKSLVSARNHKRSFDYTNAIDWN